MSTPFKKIMLVTNKPSDTEGAETTALNLAKASDASVVLVDSIRTAFHAPRMPSISTEMMFDAAIQAKQKYLEQQKARFEAEGISSSVEVLLSPRTSAELISKSISEKCDLMIRYLKGDSSRQSGRYGQTAENLIRACPIPLLLVDRPLEKPKVLACINLDHGCEENQAILEMARKLVSTKEDLYVLSCWEYTGREFMVEYLEHGMYEQTRIEMGQIYRELFERIFSEYSIEDLDGRVHLANNNPVLEIPKFCNQYKIDVAVMCSASLNHPLNRSMGSTIEKTIAHLPCGLMVVKPIGFESSV